MAEASIVKSMQRETDGEFVAAIMNCLQRPFKTTDLPIILIPGKPPPETPEEQVANWVQVLVLRLRANSDRKRVSHADDLKLIRLLRKRGYDKYADEIEENVYFFDIPPVPPKTNELKYNCAYEAHDLMTTVTEQ